MVSIKSFLEDITPNQSEILQASTSWTKIRDTIEKKLDYINHSQLTWSYKRHTKISPIDDIDIFFQLFAGNATLEHWYSNDKYRVYLDEGVYNIHILKDFTVYYNSKYYLSPNKILNSIKRAISESYTSTPDIGRNGECVTVYLSTYDMTIDCIPYMTVNDKEYYLIPTSWNDLYRKKTNPQLDENKINELNDSNNFNGKLKDIIKIMKYWNKYKNPTMKFKSYLIECIVYRALLFKSKNITYIEMLKFVIESLQFKMHRATLDIPSYEEIPYNLNDMQRDKIKRSLWEMLQKLNQSEDSLIAYLKENH